MLICGIPGAGKTTFSERYGNVVRYDDFSHLPRAERTEVFRGAEVVEGIFNSREGRMAVLGGRGGTCIWIDTPLETCVERCGLSASMHAEMFEPPTLDEGWDEIVRVSGYERRDS